MAPEAKPRDTEMVGIGGLCEEGVEVDPRDAGRLTFVVGPRHQLGYCRMTTSRWAWWCHAYGATAGERSALLTMPDAELRDRMLDRYAGWSDPALPLIRATEQWARTPIHDVPALPTWHRGPVVLIGDAAHAMSPAGGQGASMALEDAMLVARLLSEAPAEEAFARFEALRRRRAEAVVAQAYANDRRSLKELGAVGRWTRDNVMMPMFARFIQRALSRVYAGLEP